MMKLLLVIVCLSFSFTLFAQDKIVTGIISGDDGLPLSGVIISAPGTTSGAVSDTAGRFSFTVPQSVSTLVFNYIGHDTKESPIPENGQLNVSMIPSANTLTEVVVSVGRGPQRTLIDTPVPVDNITAKELATTGQFTFDKALQYRVPSFNTVNTPVNDASTLLDPYELRNLGPSRTLILINGKRKNLSSLLYVQFAPGRGETGADISGIPTDAIKRVEILRDGASAQYGSDAIAGVMNIILKDKFQYSSLNINSGVTSKGDGGTYGLTFNSGANLVNKGFVNYTVGFLQTNNAVRSGKIDVPTEIATFGNPDQPNNDPVNASIISYLNRFPTANNINGTGATSAARFLINGGVQLNPNVQLYANAAFIAKKVISNANYRPPYWRKDFGLLHTPDPNGIDYTASTNPDDIALYKGYLGYNPSFEGDLKDYNATLGVKNKIDQWATDASITVGGNQQRYTVRNTVNAGLGRNSPTAFKPGGYSFSHVVGNIDISRTFNNLGIALGSEARTETYQIIAGDTSSFTKEGSNSFPGIRTENAQTNSRFNLGGYLDLTYDITKNFLIEGAIRGEKYSDFGNAFVWKVSSRLKIIDDKLIFRGSLSTGFRAPTLHQIYAQSTQASFSGGTIVLSGLFNNISKEAFALGIPKLRPEKSNNITLGIASSPVDNFSISVDYYNITISDRVVYSSSISTDSASSPLGRILAAGNLKSVQFFINGIKTRTQGLDVVIGYKNIMIGSGSLGINIAANYTIKNEILGTPNDPELIRSVGSSILNNQIKSLLIEGRPRYKAVGGLDFGLGKFNVVLNNTLFGPTKFQDLDNGGAIMNNIKQVFSPRMVTDLNIGYSFSKNISASFTVNNIFNVLPKWKLELTGSSKDPNYEAAAATLSDNDKRNLLEGFLTFSGRYRILGYNGSQFSQLGTMFMGQLSFKF